MLQTLELSQGKISRREPRSWQNRWEKRPNNRRQLVKMVSKSEFDRRRNGAGG